jgi:hypothetical protein
MTKESEIRAAFNLAWQEGKWFNLHTNPDDGFKIWQSCQQLNDERIAAKDAEIAMLRDNLMTIIYGATKALEATND